MIVKKFKGRTSASSDPPSRDEPKAYLKEATKTHKEAKDRVSSDVHATLVDVENSYLPRLSSETVPVCSVRQL